MAVIDVVVVSYNSRRRLRECVGTLATHAEFRVVVVDNASADHSLEAIGDLSVHSVALARNHGFGYGCNVGWRHGAAPYVLFLNPDARISPEDALRLMSRLEGDATAAAAAPRIETDGELDFSLRRFPRLRSTYAQAFFLHRLVPRAAWADEVIRDRAVYDAPGSPEWVSGACILVRRDALEEIGGFDERFFLYCEDKDLCRRLRDKGFDICYVPEARAHHEGGASAPRTDLYPVLARSRVIYAHKHETRFVALLESLGVALKSATHVVVARGGLAPRKGHARSLLTALRTGMSPPRV
jgi:GT2 family glycosyltransferase